MFRSFASSSCLLLLLSVAWLGQAVAQEAASAPRTYSYAFNNQGGDDADGIKRLDSFIRQRLRDEGLLASGGKGDGKVEVTLTHYYTRSDGARAWAGVFAGRDKIASTVRLTGRDGGLLDEFEVGNANATIFGSTAGMHEKHADEIVERLKALE